MRRASTNSLLGTSLALVLCSVAAQGGSGPVRFLADPGRLTGSIAGVVRDSGGIPQMGATVFLLNKYERIVQRALTNDRGVFGFDFLPPDSYSVRVSLVSFIPAMKQKIAVLPGMQSLLYVNLASLLSSVELVYALPGQGALMSDDWKWTLKSSPATRPVLRLLPVATSGTLFSETRGLVKVSAGDAGPMVDMTQQPDVGTTFALATSVMGRNELKVSGNVGRAVGTLLPTANFRSTYTLDDSGPEIAVGFRQIVVLPSRGANTDGVPALRTMSIAFADHLDFGDNLRLEYGSSLDSVLFLGDRNYYSPFARLSYDVGRWGRVRVGYSSGAPPTQLLDRSAESEDDLLQDLTALNLASPVSLRAGQAEVRRSESFEIGYEKKLGSRTVSVSVYHEAVSNGALILAGDEAEFPGGDVIPDLSSRSAVFNVGNYENNGYTASVSQNLGDHLQISATAGRSGMFVGDAATVNPESADEIRAHIHLSERYWAAARAATTLPVVGTRITTSYEWTDANALMPTHLYLTQDNVPGTGLNVHISQPIHRIHGIPGVNGRLEATADLRNLFAQGYINLPTATGQVLLTQSPRAFRGGLSFIF